MIDTLERTVFHHQRRTAHAITTELLSRLKEKAHAPFELTAGKLLLEQMGHSQQNRRMRIMPTGVHLTGRGRRMIKPGRFVERQGIHVSPNRNRRAITKSQIADHAGLADLGANLNPADFAECICHQGRSTHLFERKFGMFVNFTAQARHFVG